MRIQFQRFEIAHAVVTRARFEVIAKRERAQGSVTARAAAIDHQTIAVYFAASRQKLRAIHAIIDVDYAPGGIQPLAIIAAIARAATIIHIEHGDATARPILNAELKRSNCRRSRSTVTLDQERRRFVRRTVKVRIFWPVEKAVGC